MIKYDKMEHITKKQITILQNWTYLIVTLCIVKEETILKILLVYCYFLYNSAIDVTFFIGTFFGFQYYVWCG